MTSPLTRPAAFLVAVLGIATFSAMDAVMKGLVLAIGIMPTVLWRGLAGLALSAILFVAARKPWPHAAAWRVHLLRGVITAVMAVLFFWGLARVPMALAVALCFIAPILALVLAALALDERVGRRVVGASGVAFGGVLVIVAGQPSERFGEDALLGAGAILLAALLYAVNIVLMRRQSQLAGPIEVAFFQNLVMTGALWCSAPFVGAHPPALVHVPALAGAAVLANASVLLLAWAYAHAPASFLAASEYTGFVWAALFGYALFGERLSPATVAGAALIVVACLAVAGKREDVGMEEELG